MTFPPQEVSGTTSSNVLIVSYLFPPVGGIGVQRPLKFTRYLGQFDWHVSVLTTDGVYSATMDHKLVNEIPQTVNVFRINDPVSRWIGRFINSNKDKSVAKSTPTTASPTFKKRLGQWLKVAKDALLIPDESVLWAIQAAFTGSMLVRKHKIACVYTTSGPNSTHLAGMLIQRWTGAKWVADFRDPWIDNMHFQRTGLRKELEARLENQVFRKADAVITVTNSFRDLFAAKYPNYQSKISVIRNGVDPHDYPLDPSPASRSGPFTIFYAGILYPERSPAAFFEALSNLLQSGLIPATNIRVQFAGVFDYPGKNDHQKLLELHHLQKNVELLGYLSHNQVIKAMNEAHALLLIGEGQAQSAMYIPGKLYEYLYTQRPILALMQDGEGANIIRLANSGIVVPPKNTVQIAEAIHQMYQSFLDHIPFTPNEAIIRQFSRIEQTNELAALLNNLVMAQNE